MQLDMSEYHGLDHSILTCKHGRGQHAKYWYELRYRQEVIPSIKHKLFKIHDWNVVVFRKATPGDTRHQVVCTFCDAKPDEDTAIHILTETYTNAEFLDFIGQDLTGLTRLDPQDVDEDPSQA